MSARAGTRIKVCGITTVEDALACVALGVDAIGLNFVPASPRAIEVDDARAIVAAVGASALVVAVVADRDEASLRALVSATGVGCLQLHGAERPELVRALLPHAYKAVRVATAADAEAIATYPGEYVLVDAKVPGVLGGSGATFDWSLVTDVARRRKLTLAGGLGPDNVARAIAIVRPFCVDVASGVELPGSPRRKDADRLARFVAAVHGAG